ncbi:MAG: hypothetical protein KDA88_23955, partial [Planctomycetaceae bacterium]|nr:hypothetical protein [Planctomycetaceae bacterium]
MPRAFNKSCLFILATSLLLGNLAFGQSVKITTPAPKVLDGVTRLKATGPTANTKVEFTPVVEAKPNTKITAVKVTPSITPPATVSPSVNANGTFTPGTESIDIPFASNNAPISLTTTVTYQPVDSAGNNNGNTFTNFLVQNLIIDAQSPEP